MYLLDTHAIKLAKNVFFFKSRLLGSISFRIKLAHGWKNCHSLYTDWINPCNCLTSKLIIP